MTSVLLVEDNQTLGEYYSGVILQDGFTLLRAETGAQAMDLFIANRPDIVAMDLMLPDRDGLELMRDCLAFHPRARFIIMTGQGTVKTAVDAMRRGAVDFLAKPFGENVLIQALRDAQTYAEFSPCCPEQLPLPPHREMSLPGQIGSSPLMVDFFQRCRLMADADLPIFMQGEPGTGKRSAVRQIHALSQYRDGPLVELDAGLSSPAEQLAVLDQTAGTACLFERAAGGTLLINEPSQLVFEAQRMLCLKLQSMARLGVQKFRLVSCASTDPYRDVANARLRPDLFNQLYVAPLVMPPLSERGEDVIALALHCMRKYQTNRIAPFTALSVDVMALFRNHPWPGNVAQLANLLRGILAQFEGPTVEMHMMPHGFSETGRVVDPDPKFGVNAFVGLDLMTIERKIIEATIDASEGSVPRAAKVLGVSPSTIYRKRETWADNQTD